LDPDFYSVYDNMAVAMEGMGRYQEAFDARTRQAEVMENPLMKAAAREDRAAFMRGGRSALIHRRLRRLLALNSPAHPQFYRISKLYCQLGDVARCLSALEKAIAERGEGTIDVKIDPSFDIIRGDARYAEIVLKFGFEPVIS
jgi:tetratricopeptide (TPR) repeat protein